ncbi:MAG TPA: YggU family protein [Planctomycetes bacterium]|nr:YggU family protein [Planctomycetota bacterium]
MSWLREVAGGVEVRLKVVPGASRSAVTGLLGDRLKVRIAAPPEGGKANQAVEELLGSLTGHRATVVAGHGNPLKSVLLTGATLSEVASTLAP